MQDQKIAKKSPSGHHRTNLSDYRGLSSQLRHAHIDNRKEPVKHQYLPHMSSQYGEFRPIAAEIYWRVWGIPANFNGFRVLAALQHVTLVVAVSQTLRRWTEGATYIPQGGHHVGHWPTFLVTVARDRDSDSEDCSILVVSFSFLFSTTDFSTSLGRFSRNFATRGSAPWNILSPIWVFIRAPWKIWGA